MRKTRLVILPTKCIHQMGFLLLFLSCPVIGDWGRIRPDTAMSHRAIILEREGTCGLKRDPPGMDNFFLKDGWNRCQPGDAIPLNKSKQLEIRNSQHDLEALKVNLAHSQITSEVRLDHRKAERSAGNEGVRRFERLDVSSRRREVDRESSRSISRVNSRRSPTQENFSRRSESRRDILSSRTNARRDDNTGRLALQNIENDRQVINKQIRRQRGSRIDENRNVNERSLPIRRVQREARRIFENERSLDARDQRREARTGLRIDMSSRSTEKGNVDETVAARIMKNRITRFEQGRRDLRTSTARMDGQQRFQKDRFDARRLQENVDFRSNNARASETRERNTRDARDFSEVRRTSERVLSLNRRVHESTQQRDLKELSRRSERSLSLNRRALESRENERNIRNQDLNRRVVDRTERVERTNRRSVREVRNGEERRLSLNRRVRESDENRENSRSGRYSTTLRQQMSETTQRNARNFNDRRSDERRFSLNRRAGESTERIERNQRNLNELRDNRRNNLRTVTLNRQERRTSNQVERDNRESMTAGERRLSADENTSTRGNRREVRSSVVNSRALRMERDVSRRNSQVRGRINDENNERRLSLVRSERESSERSSSRDQPERRVRQLISSSRRQLSRASRSEEAKLSSIRRERDASERTASLRNANEREQMVRREIRLSDLPAVREDRRNQERTVRRSAESRVLSLARNENSRRNVEESRVPLSDNRLSARRFNVPENERFSIQKRHSSLRRDENERFLHKLEITRREAMRRDTGSNLSRKTRKIRDNDKIESEMRFERLMIVPKNIRLSEFRLSEKLAENKYNFVTEEYLKKNDTNNFELTTSSHEFFNGLKNWISFEDIKKLPMMTTIGDWSTSCALGAAIYLLTTRQVKTV